MEIDSERPRLSQSVSQEEQAPLITIIHSVKGELDPFTSARSRAARADQAMLLHYS